MVASLNGSAADGFNVERLTVRRLVRAVGTGLAAVSVETTRVDARVRNANANLTWSTSVAAHAIGKMKQAYSSQPKETDPIVTGPTDQSTEEPAPKPVDPRGNEQIKWPRGLNFGNVVLLVSAFAAVLLGILALFHAEL